MATDLDTDAVKMFGFRVWSYKMGEQVALLIHLGDRLGLYQAMADAGPMTSADLADATGLNERLLREWLHGQAAAGLVDHIAGDGSPTTARFELTPIQAAVLADEAGSIDFAGGAFRGGFGPELLDAIADSFRTGIGITYEQQGPEAAAGLARMTGVRSRLELNSVVLAGLDGVVDKLTAGATVADIGCGAGVSTMTIAEAFPDSTCIGYDPSVTAIELARSRAADAGITNVEFRAIGAEDVPADASHDLVLTFDCLHDMPRPDLAADAIAKTIKPDGTWLIKDIRSTGDFDQDRRNPLLALFYGFSIASCLQSAMSTEDGLGLGTLGLHAGRAEELVRNAGFTSFVEHDFNDAANLYYEVRL